MIDANRLHHDFLEPGTQRARQFGEVYPVISTFAAIFTVISILPVTGFLVVSVLTLSFFLVTAVLIAMAASAAVVIALGTALFGFLFLASLFSLFLTSITVCGYLAYRLFSLLGTEENWTAGFVAWIGELRKQIVSRLPVDISSADAKSTTKISANGLWSNGQGCAVIADNKTPKTED